MPDLYKLLLCFILLFLVSCRSEKPDSNAALDIEKMAREAGINTTRYPGALVKPEDLKDGRRMSIIGMLREVGTARFPKLVLTPLANFDIHLPIEKTQLKDYTKLQYKFVEITGVVSVRKVNFGTVERNWYAISVESARQIQ